MNRWDVQFRLINTKTFACFFISLCIMKESIEKQFRLINTKIFVCYFILISLQNENVNREATSVSLIQDVRRPNRRTGHQPKTFNIRERMWTTFFKTNN